MPNPQLPQETSNFTEGSVTQKGKPLRQYEQLHAAELRDVEQQIQMRPLVAIFFGALLVFQCLLVFHVVIWALVNNKLGSLQLIFSVLIAGTLTQTYKISELIVNKLFEPIDYADKHERFNKEE